ncbi:MAG: ABC transporter permease [Sulfurospirillaceae bacterium]|jgi:ABC-2 type transport system permease protein|nr:ABC transporter permease [Sulfurospirillaceae bacterium]MCK9545664.1 ABC transporter permease [Sulfurospirillaceae bacterium]MDY0237994.1 ABC transporter permease subunit [Campylobacterales bacterium]
MKNLWLMISIDIKESLRSKWFLLYSVVFGGIVALFFISGVTESRVQGFSGLSRLLLIFIEVSIVILPIFILVSTVRTIAGDRDSNVLEYLLSFPIALKDYFFGRFIGRFITVSLPIVGALLLALVWGVFRGADVPWGLFFYYVALVLSLNIQFLGISFFISSAVKTQELALGVAFFVWLALLAFIDILLIGMLSRSIGSAETIYSIALANPLQVFRIGAISLFDPQLAVIGPAAYFILDTFGQTFFSIYAICYPVILGLVFGVLGYMIFKRRDLV